VGALIVALADAGYKPFEKKVATYLDILHAFLKEVLVSDKETNKFAAQDLSKVHKPGIRCGGRPP
jgi:hypothetical protein